MRRRLRGCALWPRSAVWRSTEPPAPARPPAPPPAPQILVVEPACLELLMLEPAYAGWLRRVRHIIFDEIHSVGYYIYYIHSVGYYIYYICIGLLYIL